MREYTALLSVGGGEWNLVIQDDKRNIVDTVLVSKETSDWEAPTRKKIAGVLSRKGWKLLRKVKNSTGVFIVEKESSAAISGTINT